MLIRKLSIIGVVLLAFLASCEKVPQTPPNIDKKPNVTKGVYKVVAHRGGYLECNRPDCSISSLKYAISLGCWGSECDICITGDNQVLVAHTKSGYLINGLTPYDHTLAELRAAGKLANGEELPTLQDFLNVILDKELNPNGMILQLDCKRLTKDDKEIDVNHTIRAINRACEIVQEMKAQKMVEFLIPTGTDIFKFRLVNVNDSSLIRIIYRISAIPESHIITIKIRMFVIIDHTIRRGSLNNHII